MRPAGTNRGFTIVELIIVIVVIGILAAVSIVAYNGIQRNAIDSSVLSDADSVASEVVRYSTKNDGELGAAVEWYSEGSPNANIMFSPSNGNIIDVVADTSRYCIRVYNPASQYPSVSNAYIKESESGSCSALSASGGALASLTNLSWTASTGAGVHDWSAAAVSSNGSSLAVAVSDGGYVYTSDDSGDTWTARTSLGSHYWTSLAMSSDGTKIVAAYGTGVPGSYLYRSTDSGENWTQLTSAGQRQSWDFVRSSADGTVLYAFAGAFYNPGYILRSTDSGATWTELTSGGQRGWDDLTVSSNGTQLIASADGDIYTSTDSGANWTQRTFGASPYYGYLASSSDTSKVIATAYEGEGSDYLKYSNDAGATWSNMTSAGQQNWNGLGMSADGQRMVAGVNDDDNYSDPQGGLYVSVDGGSTWSQETGPGTGAWRAVEMSSNGLLIIAGSYYSTYTSHALYTGTYN